MSSLCDKIQDIPQNYLLLFSITDFIIDYLDFRPEEPTEHFYYEKAPSYNKKYIEYINKEKQFAEIAQLTDQFGEDLHITSHLLDDDGLIDYKEYYKTMSKIIRTYAKQVITLFDDTKLKKFLSNNPSFATEYEEALKNSLYGITAAEKSLMYWKNAIPDNILLDSLLSLRYAYILQHKAF